MTKNVGIEIVENSGPNNLRDALRAKLAKASEVSIAVAFITEAGLSEIVQSLRQVASHGKVRLITGLYQSVTEPNALKTLLRIQKETRSNFIVRLSREPQFHRKLFLIENRSTGIAIVGSSNLTQEGLRSGGELSLMASFRKSDQPYKRLKEAFEKDWSKRRSVFLAADQIGRYKKSRPSGAKQYGYTKNQLKNILGVDSNHEAADLEDEPITFRRDGITGFVKKRTEQIISESTNWDDKNYTWFGTGGSHPYRIGDRIFMFDLPDKRFSLVEVKDITRTPMPTPDGRHFIAFRQVGRHMHRLTNSLWEKLDSIGVKKKDAPNTRKVTTKARCRLTALLTSSR